VVNFVVLRMARELARKLAAESAAMAKVATFSMDEDMVSCDRARYSLGV
jgi:hypothetical protein